MSLSFRATCDGCGHRSEEFHSEDGVHGEPPPGWGTFSLTVHEDVTHLAAFDKIGPRHRPMIPLLPHEHSLYCPRCVRLLRTFVEKSLKIASV